MSSRNKIVLWVPLKPGSKWRAQGIAQTLEALLKFTLPNILYEVVCLDIHKEAIEESIGQDKHIKFCCIKTIGYESVVEYAAVIHPFLASILSLVFKIFLLSIYLIAASYYAATIRLRKDIKAIWCPTFATIYSCFNFGHKKVVNFWDGFVFEYNGFADVRSPIFKRLMSYLKSADSIITQSEHNKKFLECILKIESNKIQVIQNLNPSYSHIVQDLTYIECKKNKAEYLNYWISPNQKYKTLREATRNVSNLATLYRLITEIKDERTKVIFVSSQIRPYKGFSQLFMILDQFQKQYKHIPIRLITTAMLDDFLDRINFQYTWAYKNVYQFHQVCNNNHALLYALSDLVVHPSFAEGGHGAYPFFEALSVGKVALMNEGPHTKEFLRLYPKLDELCVDFNDLDAVVEKIKYLLCDNSAQKRLLNLAKESSIDNYSISVAKYLTFFEGL